MKHPPALLWLILTVSLVSLTGCHHLEESDPATLIEVKAGHEFTIVIRSNPSTGYRWQLVEPLDETIVRFVTQEYEEDKPVRPGSGGWDIWKFEAVGPGETAITLGHFPPDSNTTPYETTTFTVIVQ